MLEFFAPLFSQMSEGSASLLSLRWSLGQLPIIYQITTIMLTSSILFALLYRFMMWWFARYGLMDRPDKYGLRRAPVPFAVWVSLYIGFALMSFLLFDITQKLAIILALWGFLVLYTFLDDLVTIEHPLALKIHPALRLTFQILIGAIIGLTSIKIAYISGLLDGIISLTVWSFMIGEMIIYPIALTVSIAWYVILFNVINWSDEVPGVSSGISLITFVTLFILAIKLYLVDQSATSQENAQFVLLLLAVLIPGVALHFWLSLKPRIWWADSGTMFLGFMIATLAIIAGGKIATVATVLWVYLIDFFYVIIARILQRKNPLKWDRVNHLHFRLISLGMRRSQIRHIVLSLTAFFGIAAVFLDKIGKIFFFFFIAILVFSIANIIESTKQPPENN